jgi:hypothetical protein
MLLVPPNGEQLMRHWIKRVFSRWKLDNTKVIRRIIVSVVGATVRWIKIALQVKTESTIRAEAA